MKTLGISPELIEARDLQQFNEATELEIVEIAPGGREHLLIPVAGAAWRHLKAAAESDGESLYIVSSFRTIDHQEKIIQTKLDVGINIEEILKGCAPPGYSEHHTGRAIDISTPGVEPLSVDFENTSAFFWLQENAGNFGFTLSYPEGNAEGYMYEPWHWCYQNT